MANSKFSIFILTIIIFFFACGDNSESNNNTSTPESTATNSTDSKQQKTPTSYKNIETVDAKPFEEKEMIFAWVDKLNIRDASNLKAKTITAVESNDALKFTGEQSDQIEEIVLRGVAYDEPWLKIITPDDKEGWVYGGAVKRKSESKGNAPITDTKFDFPHFGNFDLSTWKKLGTRLEGEEVDIQITTYQKGDQILEVTSSEMGEFYYGYDYKLMDRSEKILKHRSFSFTSDGKMLEEKVKDYSTNTEYTRNQTLKKHFYQLNAKPVMVNGKWTNRTFKDETTSAVPSKTTTTSIVLQPFELLDCANHVEKEFDCACFFSTEDYYKGQAIFGSNMDKAACVKVEGELNALYPDWEDRDYKAELKKLAESKDWIVVRDGGVEYFGKPLSDYKYGNGTEFLTDVILASGKKIDAIPIKNTATGMAIREIRDEANDAIAAAKAYRSKGGNDPLTILKMDNRRYDVIVRYRQITQYEGEANKYEGRITLLSHRTKKILDERTIKGNCGC
ncbi:MAG: SH3 domain-containing protein [Saprospiraceae bacterium]